MKTALALVALALCWPSQPSPAAADKPLTAFLSRNKEILDLDVPAHFRAALIDTAGKEIFLLGESHGIAVNNDLDLALLEYLRKTAGVRVYLAEINYSASLLIESYIKTGDETLLDFLFRQLQGTIAWNREYREFLVKFRQWNLSLAESERVRFVGIDLEHQPLIAVWGLNHIINDAVAAGRPIPDPLREMLARVTRTAAMALTPSGAAPDPLVLRTLSDNLAASVRDDRPDYAFFLGNRLFDFELITKNWQITYGHHAAKSEDGYPKYNQLRDRTIYETFLKVHARMPDTRWYGRWGNYHVAQRRSDSTDWFASLLSSPDSPLAGKVASIWPLHENSSQLTGERYQSQPVAGDDPELVRAASAATSARITLFKLTGPDSPFAKALYGFRSDAGGVTTDFVQYFLLIRNGTPAHPFEPAVRTTTGAPPGRSGMSAHADRRMQMDRERYSAEQLKEIEALFQAGFQKSTLPEGQEMLKQLVNRFPDANRAGCATVTLGERAAGNEKERYLESAIGRYGDCWFRDLVQVAPYARFLLAARYLGTGRSADAEHLLAEIRKDYPGAIDHYGRPLLPEPDPSRFPTLLLLNAATEKLHDGKFDEAIAGFQKALDPLDAKSAEAADLRRRIGQTRRQKRDVAAYSAGQLREIESLYLAGNAKWMTAEGREMLQQVVSRFPESNRAGCAVLDLAQTAKGDEMDRHLKTAIDRYSDSWYDNLVQVGALARYSLAIRYLQIGKTADARSLLEEGRKNFPDAIDSSGNVLFPPGPPAPAGHD